MSENPAVLVAQALGQAITPKNQFLGTWKFVLCLFLSVVIAYFGWDMYTDYKKEQKLQREDAVTMLASSNAEQTRVIGVIEVLKEDTQVAVKDSIVEKEQIVEKVEVVKEKTKTAVQKVRKKAAEAVKHETEPIKIEAVKIQATKEVDRIQITSMWQTYCEVSGDGGSVAACMAQVAG